MGTVDRDGKLGGSLVDGIKRRAGALQASPPPANPTPAPAPASSVSGAPTGLRELADAELDGELPELGGFGHVPGAPFRRGLPRGLQRREPTTMPGMLGFGFVDGFGWTAQPQRPFKPRGLYIVGELSTGDRLEQAIVGQEYLILQSCAGVPAHFFATARTYEQIAKAVADGQELPAWGEWRIVHPGQQLVIAVRSRAGELLGPGRIDLGMWGSVLT